MKKKIVLLFIPLIIMVLFARFGKKEKSIIVEDNNYEKGIISKFSEILIDKSNSENITNYYEGNVNEMYVLKHPETYHVKSEKDYRYVGYDVNNYIYFNCQDINNTSTCERWRIIGLFEENGKYKVKIINNNSIGKFPYDKNGSTNWRGSSLNEYLQIEYQNSLSQSSINMIKADNYYLNQLEYSELMHYKDFYSEERKSPEQSNFSGQYEDYATIWYGKIALMYPSDYLYTIGVDTVEQCSEDYDGKCLQSWIDTDNQITLLNRESILTSEDQIYSVKKASLNYIESTELSDILPVLYLDENVLYVSGDGTYDNPYYCLSASDYVNYNFEYKKGDKIYYNNELYYIIDESTKESDYVVALKDVPLTEKYTKYFSKAEISFYESDKCYFKDNLLNDTSDCKNNYDTSNIKNIVENWANNELDSKDLVSVNGYKVRLLTIDEIIDNFNFDTITNSSNAVSYIPTNETPNFIKERPYYISSWTMSSNEDGTEVFVFSNSINTSKVYSKKSIEPVINFKKTALGKQKEYKIGDKVSYKDNLYYVINNSSNDIDYVTVMKAEELNYKQIMNYINNDEIDSVEYKICNTDGCENTDYNSSNVKKIVDYWLNNNFDENDLVNIDGYKGRLLTMDELIDQFYYTYESYNVIASSWSTYLACNYETPKWIYTYNYWTMTGDEDTKEAYVVKADCNLEPYDMGNLKYIRPVIYLKKSSINKVKETPDHEENKCTVKYRKEKITKYNEYKIGQEIKYNNEKYYVINDSSNKNNYVTLLKANVLENENNQPLNTFFYRNEKCTNINNYEGCSNKYEESNIIKILNKWINDNNILKDLIEVNGYKVRLLNAKDLLEKLQLDLIKYQKPNGMPLNAYYSKTTPKFLYENMPKYWTMINDYQNNNSAYIIDENGYLTTIDLATENILKVYDEFSVRPVINLNKCVLDQGCIEEEIEIEDGCIEDDINPDIKPNIDSDINPEPEIKNDNVVEDKNIINEIIDAPITASFISKIIIIVSVIFIIIGNIIIIYNYIKSKKDI